MWAVLCDVILVMILGRDTYIMDVIDLISLYLLLWMSSLSLENVEES